MCNYHKTKVSLHDPTKLAIDSILHPNDYLISVFGQKFRKTVSFDDIVHFIEEDNFLTHVGFDSGVTFHPQTATKIRQSSRERNYISRSCEKTNKCSPGNDQHKCSIDEQHTSNIFLNQYSLWDIVPAAALLSLGHTNDTVSTSKQ